MKCTEIILQASKEISWEVNTDVDKTKYICMTQNQDQQQYYNVIISKEFETCSSVNWTQLLLHIGQSSLLTLRYKDWRELPEGLILYGVVVYVTTTFIINKSVFH